MIGTIRKHQKWLWAVIITFTVISFVVYFSPYQRMSGGLGGRRSSRGAIGGQPVTEEGFREAWADVNLRYLLAHGTWPDKDAAAKQMGFDEVRDTYYRLLLLQKIKEANIQVSSKVVGRVAADVLRSFRRGGVSLEEFEKEVLLTGRMTAADFERFLRHELAAQQLIHVAGLCGTLVTPAEAKALYRHEHEELTAALVVFPATNYLERVTVTPAALGQFYTNQMPDYRIPERVQVSYVEFDLTNYWAAADAVLAKLTNLTAILDAIYEQRGTNYYRDAKSPEDAKQQIKEEIRKNEGLKAARRQAAEFAEGPFNQEPLRAANLAEAASRSNLTVRVTAPFDMNSVPVELEVRSDFTRAAFGLTEDEPFAGPIVGDDGVYVIALHKRLPSEIPSLDSIRARVTQDFKLQEAVKLAHQAGADFYNVLTNGLAQGKSFPALCRDARLKLVLPPPFSRSTRSLPVVEEYMPLGFLQEVAFKVPPSKVSNFIPTTDGGFIVNVQSLLPADEQKMEAELPSFLPILRQTAQNEAFNAWFRKQAEQDPGFRRILEELAKRERPATINRP